MPRALSPHDGQRRLGDPQGAEQIGFDLRARLSLAYFLDGAEETIPSIVDHHVQTAEAPMGGSDGCVDRRLVRNIERERRHLIAVALDQWCECLHVSRRCGHPISARQRCLCPDATETL